MGFDINYVLDKMMMFEALNFLKFGYLREKETWEQTRWMGNLYLNSMSKQKVELKDTIKFTWEESEDEEDDIDPAAMHRHLNDIANTVSKMKFEKTVIRDAKKKH